MTFSDFGLTISHFLFFYFYFSITSYISSSRGSRGFKQKNEKYKHINFGSKTTSMTSEMSINLERLFIVVRSKNYNFLEITKPSQGKTELQEFLRGIGNCKKPLRVIMDHRQETWNSGRSIQQSDRREIFNCNC